MTDIATSTIEGAPGWQPLAEFEAVGLPGSEQQLLDQVMDAVPGLRLHPAQLDTIHHAFVQAVERMMRNREPAAICPLRIRIWVADDCISSRGWGFFLLEKGNVPQSMSTDTDYLLELFLYQECDS